MIALSASPRRERHRVLHPAHHAELPEKILGILPHGVHTALPLLEDLLHPDAAEIISGGGEGLLKHAVAPHPAEALNEGKRAELIPEHQSSCGALNELQSLPHRAVNLEASLRIVVKQRLYREVPAPGVPEDVGLIKRALELPRVKVLIFRSGREPGEDVAALRLGTALGAERNLPGIYKAQSHFLCDRSFLTYSFLLESMILRKKYSSSG